MAVKPIPGGYHTITPYLVVRGAGEWILMIVDALYQRAVDAGATGQRPPSISAAATLEPLPWMM
jgi:hypothetical protein